VTLSSDMPMASRFDPRLPTTVMPAEQKPIRYRASAPLCPERAMEIAFVPLGHLSAWIRSGALTSRRLTQIYLDRIAALNPSLFCFATVTPERALAEADAADKLLAKGTHRGPLHGIPYGLKDLFDTAGIVTGWGAKPFQNRRPDRDATIVGKLRAAAAVLLGKTTVEAARSLDLNLVEVSLPDLPYGALMNVLYAEAAAAVEDLTLGGLDDTLTRQDEGAWPNTFRKARFLSTVDHVQLDRLRYQVMLAVDGLFQQVDVVIGPFMTGPMLVATNFTGHPCLHLRAGFLDLATRGAASLATGKLTTGEPGTGQLFRVPQGISLWGRLFAEGPLLNLGMALERVLDVASLRPELAA